jgi:hypothetical protein
MVLRCLLDMAAWGVREGEVADAGELCESASDVDVVCVRPSCWSQPAGWSHGARLLLPVHCR